MAKFIGWITFFMVKFLRVVATSRASCKVMVFNNVASFQSLLHASYMARSVVTKFSREASTISCLPRLVTSGRSADASKRYFTLFPCPRAQVRLPILGLFCCSSVLLTTQVFPRDSSILILQGIYQAVFSLFHLC